MNKVNKIAIMTSGGDCAGLNAVIRGVVVCAKEKGWEVYGIKNATQGLMSRPVQYHKLTKDEMDLLDMLNRGGTLLGTVNKGDPFEYEATDNRYGDYFNAIIDGYNSLGVDGLIGVGGDGSMRIVNELAKKGGVPFIGIPKTIDNDVGCTDFSVGFQTALSIATDAIDKLQTTARSHSRTIIVEVMGRDVGHLALQSGIAGGANIILIPELGYNLNVLGEQLKQVTDNGRKHAIVVVSEAVHEEDKKAVVNNLEGEKIRYGGISEYLSKELSRNTGLEIRSCKLGHIQRGGSPCMQDKLLASRFAAHAVELLNIGKTGRVVGIKGNITIDKVLDDVVNTYSGVDLNGDLINTAKSLGILFGIDFK